MEITLYHGSDCRVEGHFDSDFTNRHNDFGNGLYCTESEELAKEWAVDDGRDGYLNRYTLDTEGLRVLDLGAKEYSLLHWAALVSANRQLYEGDYCDVEGARQFLAEHFSVDTEGYDIIKGYPGDDCMFCFFMDFIGNCLSVCGLAKAARIDGRMQTVIKSPEAFSRLRSEGSERVPAERYYRNRKMRCGVILRRYYNDVRYEKNDITIADLMTGKKSLEDPALWEK
ncbi:MAG: DUF3990 domain-containing protein [Clostridia bacterium]|nr:DUF3990 domain-containing protein [Clostridia bacterium]